MGAPHLVPVRVLWGRSISGEWITEKRILERVLPRYRAAEFAADIIFMLSVPGSRRPRSEDYLTDADTTRISWRNSSGDAWVEVLSMGE